MVIDIESSIEKSPTLVLFKFVKYPIVPSDLAISEPNTLIYVPFEQSTLNIILFDKRLTKENINKAYLKIQKKIHPDISPETSRLSSIVNEARDVLLNEIK